MNIQQFNSFYIMAIRTVLTSIRENPAMLKQASTLQHFLQTQGNTEAQGTGNKVTPQEACFAEVLESNGFTFLAKPAPATETNWYKYQPNGTQKSPDFEVFDASLKTRIKFDLKHTSGKSFYFNDGWFEKDLVYVISWSPKRGKNSVLIGYGEDIPTPEENEEMIRFVKFKKDCNKEHKKVGSLRKCVRFANQYSCQTFTEEFSTEKFNRVLASFPE